MKTESGASSVIGVVLLISLVVISAGIATVVIFNAVTEASYNGPQVSFQVADVQGENRLYHAGGDNIDWAVTKIYYDGKDITHECKVADYSGDFPTKIYPDGIADTPKPMTTGQVLYFFDEGGNKVASENIAIVATDGTKQFLIYKGGLYSGPFIPGAESDPRPLPVYYANYTAGEGTGGPVSKTYNVKTITVRSTDGFSCTGKEFLGWKSDEDNLLYQPGDSYTIKGNNVTFTAQWESNVYDITYKYYIDTKGKSAAVPFTPVAMDSSKTFMKKFTASDSTLPLPDPKITLSGGAVLHFLKWYVEDTLGNLVEVTDPYTITAYRDLTFYAECSNLLKVSEQDYYINGDCGLELTEIDGEWYYDNVDKMEIYQHGFSTRKELVDDINLWYHLRYHTTKDAVGFNGNSANSNAIMFNHPITIGRTPIQLTTGMEDGKHNAGVEGTGPIYCAPEYGGAIFNFNLGATGVMHMSSNSNILSLYGTLNPDDPPRVTNQPLITVTSGELSITSPLYLFNNYNEGGAGGIEVKNGASLNFANGNGNKKNDNSKRNGNSAKINYNKNNPNQVYNIGTYLVYYEDGSFSMLGDMT